MKIKKVSYVFMIVALINDQSYTQLIFFSIFLFP